jgi:hypothetical protein
LKSKDLVSISSVDNNGDDFLDLNGIVLVSSNVKLVVSFT